jgi:hypothetical protein
VTLDEKTLEQKMARGQWMDRLGMWISATCAVHCATLPLLLTVAGFGWLGDERLEWGIIASSFAIASWRLTQSFRAHHGRWDALRLFFAGGLLILAAKAELLPLELAEPALMTAGGSLIALAHWRNHQMSDCCAADGPRL